MVTHSLNESDENGHCQQFGGVRRNDANRCRAQAFDYPTAPQHPANSRHCRSNSCSSPLSVRRNKLKALCGACGHKIGRLLPLSASAMFTVMNDFPLPGLKEVTSNT